MSLTANELTLLKEVNHELNHQIKVNDSNPFAFITKVGQLFKREEPLALNNNNNNITKADEKIKMSLNKGEKVYYNSKLIFFHGRKKNSLNY